MKTNGNEKRRIEISIETREIKIIRIRGAAGNTAYCPQCKTEKRYFTPAEIAGIFQIANDEFVRRIESGEIHLIQNEQNLPRVCGVFTEIKTNYAKNLLNE